MRTVLFIIVALCGTSIGYWQGLRGTSTPASTRATKEAGGIATREAAAAPAASSAASRRPLPVRDAREAATNIVQPMLALPPPTSTWSAAQDELRRRAEEGDAVAAREWIMNDARCFSMQYYPGSGTLPTPAFQRAYGGRGRDQNFPNLKNADNVLLTDAAGDATVLRSSLGEVQQRLLDECQGYQPQNPRIRYALGEIAARNGDPKDFWNFIRRPPFTPQSLRDIDQARDWAERAPRMLEQHAASGDTEAAYALGLAYMQDGQPNWRGEFRGTGLLDNAIDNDPVQAYRWLSVYANSGSDAESVSAAQQRLAEIAAQLDPAQRAEAERWAREYAATHFVH